MKKILSSLTLTGFAVAILACSGDKKTKVEGGGDSTTLAVAEVDMAIKDANIIDTEWTLGMAHDVLYNFKADHTCSIKSLLDTAAIEFRKATWKLSGDTLVIVESDTSRYKVTELTTAHLSISSINKPKETDDENYDQATDDYFFLSEGSDARLSRELVLFSKKQHTPSDSRLLHGLWNYKGYYSLADKSFEFGSDGTYTYIEGPRAEEKYISLKQKGTWLLQNNLIRLTRATDRGEQVEDLTLKKITTSRLIFDEKKEVYLKAQSQ